MQLREAQAREDEIISKHTGDARDEAKELRRQRKAFEEERKRVEEASARLEREKKAFEVEKTAVAQNQSSCKAKEAAAADTIPPIAGLKRRVGIDVEQSQEEAMSSKEKRPKTNMRASSTTTTLRAILAAADTPPARAPLNARTNALPAAPTGGDAPAKKDAPLIKSVASVRAQSVARPPTSAALAVRDRVQRAVKAANARQS